MFWFFAIWTPESEISELSFANLKVKIYSGFLHLS